MKAIGIKNRKVRGLYITKYFAISSVGAIVGFIISIPLANLFLRQVSRNVIIANGAGMFLINLSCSAMIVAVVLLFCYFCTHQVNRFSPIDAIRNGSNGERFRRKGLLKLGKSRLSPAVFLALNDIFSGLKKYSVLIITFTLGTILVILPLNSINTLKSDKLITWFGMADSDVFMVNENDMADFRSNGRDYVREYLNGIEDTLKQNGIPAKVFCENLFKFKITYQGLSYNSFAQQGTGIDTDEYNYTKGQPPKYANEVAMTKITADKIGANIGDTVRIKTGDKEEEFIVTAFYQSMNNLGEGIRFAKDAELDYSINIGTFAVQIRFTDQPTVNEEKDRLEIIKKLFPKYEVKNGQGYLSWVMGNITGQLDGMKKLVLLVVLMINLLVAVLMEKTFVTKERGEIGMLKSIGFGNVTIVKWQAARIGIVLLISTVLGALLSNPAAKVSTAKLFQMMGASNIDFVIKPFEVYLMYPLIIFAVTMTASILTALQARRITAHETNNIE
jgi:putative ABC transport system permease protein